MAQSNIPRMGRGKFILKLLEESKERERKEKERKEEMERELQKQREQIEVRSPNDKTTQTDEQPYRPTGIIFPSDHFRTN